MRMENLCFALRASGQDQGAVFGVCPEFGVAVGALLRHRPLPAAGAGAAVLGNPRPVGLSEPPLEVEARAHVAARHASHLVRAAVQVHDLLRRRARALLQAVDIFKRAEQASLVVGDIKGWGGRNLTLRDDVLYLPRRLQPRDGFVGAVRHGLVQSTPSENAPRPVALPHVPGRHELLVARGAVACPVAPLRPAVC